MKIQFPDRESEHEAAALALWDGHGAVRLLAHDPDRHALLLERCEPGTPLSDLRPDDALDVMVDLLPRLWKPAGAPFRSLAEEAAWWAEQLPDQWERTGRPFERRLLDAALEILDTLPPAQGERVLLQPPRGQRAPDPAGTVAGHRPQAPARGGGVRDRRPGPGRRARPGS
ncbi:MAG: aminoglycoside phosphotransferase family protein [Actinomycetota bacterium]